MIERITRDKWWVPIPGDERFAIGWDGVHTSDWYAFHDQFDSRTARRKR